MSVVAGEQEKGVSPGVAEIHRKTLTKHPGERVRLTVPGAVEGQSLKLAVALLL
jgi:hypothetical protein